MNQNLKIVCLGGGTGLSNLLFGLKKYFADISAIVAMTDDGLSTGRIRRDFRILPPGDIRKCLIALSDNKILKDVFNYRFNKARGLSRHSLGNLIILALEKITGGFNKAIIQAGKILNIQGAVIPSTLENIQLAGKLKNGKIIVGERKLFLLSMKSRIQQVWLVPEKVSANSEAIKAIAKAQVIIIGPGSFYTSIIPNLLIKNITQAIISNKKAQRIYVCNISTERGETQGFGVEDHIRSLHVYSHPKIVKYCLVNSKIISRSKKQYKLGEINNITTDQDIISGVHIIRDNVIDNKNPLYHNSDKLAKSICKIVNEK